MVIGKEEQAASGFGFCGIILLHAFFSTTSDLRPAFKNECSFCGAELGVHDGADFEVKTGSGREFDNFTHQHVNYDNNAV